MRKILYKSLILSMVSLNYFLPNAYAQIGIGTTSPNASAALDISDTGKGFLPPRMTHAQKIAITSPAAGLTIWCTNCGYKGELQVYNGTTWTEMDGGNASAAFICGTSTVTFTYNGASVTYGTASGDGRCWLNRNLGATRVATSSDDVQAYGDVFQWGRLADGHQVYTSATINTLSSGDVPNNTGKFITTGIVGDWRNTPNNSLWNGVNGINNPCPSAWRVPTIQEFNSLATTFSSQDAAGAWGSNLKLTMNRFRDIDGFIYTGFGHYWSSSASSFMGNPSACSFRFDGGFVGNSCNNDRAGGQAVRCILD